ncbi:TfuA-like protein [Jatrophihabitans sp.]|jgi:hypothetical protein|uniref:TfuA-like protein n=1 Tax=Jatrophihabitans sp. TaxID=1932789 RepID=UPI002EF2E52C
MAQDFVFIGPSLPKDEVRQVLPAATILPPVRHGDLLGLDPEPGDRVLIIDGLFLQAAPVRHKEILMVLERGVTVAGSSSMGALRAAELWRYGMRGVGEVFRLYRDEVVTGDDEVAIIHCSAEEEYRALSEPLVSIRVVLREAVRAGVLTEADSASLLSIAQRIPFRSRSLRALDVQARQEMAADTVERFSAWARANGKDQKAEDARLLLAMAAAGHPELRPAGDGDTPVTNTGTHLTRAWAQRFHGRQTAGHWVSDLDTTIVTMLLHPNYVAEHRQQVLASIAGVPSDDPTAEARAVCAASQRGIDREALSLPAGWLAPWESRLPVEEATARLLVRAFGTWPAHLLNSACVPPAMTTPAHQAWARKAAAAAARCNSLMPTTTNEYGTVRRTFRAEAVDRHFAALWSCAVDELEPAVWDRGLPGLAAFRRVAEPYIALLTLAGAPLPPET